MVGRVVFEAGEAAIDFSLSMFPEFLYASPAARRFASLISEYLRDNTTP